MKIKVGKNRISFSDSIIAEAVSKEDAIKKALANDPFNLKNDPAVVKAFGEAYDSIRETKDRKIDQK